MILVIGLVIGFVAGYLVRQYSARLEAKAKDEAMHLVKRL